MFVKSYLSNNTQIPNLPAPFVYISPPAANSVGANPHIYIWGGTFHEKRQTMPRGNKSIQSSTAGFKEINYNIDLYLLWNVQTTDTDADEKFPLFVDAVLDCLRTIPLVQYPLLDPTTNAKSQLLDIGEIMDVEYSVPHALKDQRFWRYTARITTKVKETFQS